jgi:hypothetical protein
MLMPQQLIIITILVLFLTFSFHTANAYSSCKIFQGRIVDETTCYGIGSHEATDKAYKFIDHCDRKAPEKVTNIHGMNSTQYTDYKDGWYNGR